MATAEKKPAILFDWGGTLMRVFDEETGLMASWSRVEVLPGVREALERLSGRYTLVLATKAADSDEAAIEKALARGGIAPFIHRIFCRTNTGIAKPEPEFYLKVMEDLGLSASDCLMVGDTLEDDVLAPCRLGMHAVLFDGAESISQPSDWPVIRHFSELSKLADTLLAEGTAS